MFYENELYLVVSEKKIDDKPELQEKYPDFYKNSPEFWDIECKALKEYDHCIYCKEKSIKKKNVGIKKVYEYNERKDRIERVHVARQRYRCNECLKTFIVESTVDDITYTKDFERCISLQMIEKQYSSTLLGAKYERSYKYISDIVHRYTSNMLLGFTPPQNCEALCLYPFIYQRKHRYFLASYTTEEKWKFVCFFGYIDAMQEMRNYFSYSVNNELTVSKPVLLTDYDDDLIRLLNEVLDNPKIAFIRELMESRLEHLKIASSIDEAHDKATSINNLITIIFGENRYKRKDRLLKIKKGAVTLRSWKTEVKKHDLLSKCFSQLLDKLKEYNEYLLRSKEYDEIVVYLKDLMVIIEKYNGMNLSYDILTARMISLSYGNYGIDTEHMDMFMSPDNYDPTSETYYRQPLEKIPITNKKDKTEGVEKESWKSLNEEFSNFDWTLDGNLPFGND